MNNHDEPPLLTYLEMPGERDPDVFRDERIDAELHEMFEDIDFGTQVEILERLLKEGQH